MFGFKIIVNIFSLGTKICLETKFFLVKVVNS